MLDRSLIAGLLIFTLCFFANIQPSYATQGDSSVFVYESSHVGKNDKYHKDKSRKNILVVPHTSRPDDLTLIVWFHGLGGFSEKTFKRVMTQIDKVSSDGHSVAILIPEMPWSINTSTKRSRQGRIWKKKNQFKDFLQESLVILKKDFYKRVGVKIKNPNIIVIGHSAGGSAIMSASIEGSLCDSHVSTIVWSDASYGSWLSRANRGCLRNSGIHQIIVVRKWDKPHKNSERFLKSNPEPGAYKHIVLDRRKFTHSAIGNKILSITKLFPPGC